MKKKRKSIYQRLNKKEREHIREAYFGAPSRITIKRIAECIDMQNKEGYTCYECRSILRKLTA